MRWKVENRLIALICVPFHLLFVQEGIGLKILFVHFILGTAGLCWGGIYEQYHFAFFVPSMNAFTDLRLGGTNNTNSPQLHSLYPLVCAGIGTNYNFAPT